MGIEVDLRSLEEYDSLEKETAERLLGKTSEQRSLSIIDFYPELNWVRESTYSADLPTRFSAIDPELRSIPIWVILPYYDRIIVGLEPLRDRETFKAWYGVDIETLHELVTKRKVTIRVNNRPQLYANLEYLDPLLEMRPPTLRRSEAYAVAMLGRENFLSIREQAETMLKALSPDALTLSLQWRDPSTFWEASVRLCERLASLGYWNVVSDTFNTCQGKMESFIRRIRIYYLTLCGSVYRSLGGVHALPKDRIMAGVPAVRENFPVDVGKFLVTNLELVRPQSLEHALDIFPDFKRARQALFKIDALLEGTPTEADIQDRISELRQAWSEVAAVERSVRTRTSMVKSIGVVGGIASGLTFPIAGLPSILASFGFGIMAMDEVAQPTAETITKLRKKAHVLEIYDFKKEVDKWKRSL